VVVDLGNPVDVSLVVIRGCACVVEGSTDGSRWTAIGTASTSEAEMKPSRPVRARFLRAGGPGQSFSQLRELSVWS
jgi:hypothetical protein